MRMKSNAMSSVLVATLLLATVGILIPSVKSSGGQVGLQILPEQVVYNGPAYGKVFTINVTVANVTDLFGYEFKLSWNTTLLNCTAAVVTPPVNWSSNYLIAVNQVNNTLGQYWLAVGALNVSGVTAFTGNTSLASLTFEVIYDPLQDTSSTIGFPTSTTILADKNGLPIDHTNYNGTYQYYANTPVVEVFPSSYTADAGGITFTAEVWVFNVSGLIAFDFTLTFNETLLVASVPSIGTFFSSHWRTRLFRDVGIASVEEDSFIPAYGSGLLGRVNLTTRMQASNAKCNLTLAADLYSASGPIPFNTADGQYKYAVLPGDPNADCSVDLRDFYIVAMAFGSQPGDPNWDARADLTNDGKVDLLDLMQVCIDFGKSA
jgi:hypothetical protein